MNLPSKFITGEARAVTSRLRKRARATGKMRFRKPTTTSPASRMSTRHVMPAARVSVGESATTRRRRPWALPGCGSEETNASGPCSVRPGLGCFHRLWAREHPRRLFSTDVVPHPSNPCPWPPWVCCGVRPRRWRGLHDLSKGSATGMSGVSPFAMEIDSNTDRVFHSAGEAADG